MALGESWEVTGCEYQEEAASFFVVIQETARLWEQERCPKCRRAVRCYDHVEALSWRHLNVFNKQSEILCELPRGRCGECRHTYRVKPPWEGKSKHFTQEFEAFALTLMREMPMKKVGEIVGVDDMRLGRMLLAYVDEAYAKLEMRGSPAHQPPLFPSASSEVTCVGADEINRRKGHNYLTVFCDLLRKRVLFACEGKEAKAWKAFAQALCEHNGDPESIAQASIDMSPAYIKGVKENAPNAEIVFDKFHVVRAACDGSMRFGERSAD